MALVAFALAALLLVPRAFGKRAEDGWHLYHPRKHARALTVVEVIDRRFRSHARVARCIAWFESKRRRYAVSRTDDVGVFQINYLAHHRPGESFVSFKRRFFNVTTNVDFAYRLSSGGTSWGAWTTHYLCGV